MGFTASWKNHQIAIIKLPSPPSPPFYGFPWAVDLLPKFLLRPFPNFIHSPKPNQSKVNYIPKMSIPALPSFSHSINGFGLHNESKWPIPPSKPTIKHQSFFGYGPTFFFKWFQNGIDEFHKWWPTFIFFFCIIGHRLRISGCRLHNPMGPFRQSLYGSRCCRRFWFPIEHNDGRRYIRD